MLVCQCNVIAAREIRETVLALLREDPWQIIVPAKVYRLLGQRCKCAGCVPNVVDIITAVTQEYRQQAAALPPPPAGANTRPAAPRRKRPGGWNERRSTGHRAT